MIPLPQTKVQKIKPLVEAFIRESKCEDRTTAQHCLEKLAQGYLTKTMDAYVDSVDSPRRMIVFGRYPGLLFPGDMIVVHCIYAPEEDRGKEEVLAAFKEILAKYPQVHSADRILASSWVYKNSRGIDAFWRSLGFERQEVIYVKHLKEVNHG